MIDSIPSVCFWLSQFIFDRSALAALDFGQRLNERLKFFFVGELFSQELSQPSMGRIPADAGMPARL